MLNDVEKFEKNLESLGYRLAIMASEGKNIWFLLGDPTTRIITDRWQDPTSPDAILHRYDTDKGEWVEQGRYTEADISAAAEQHNFVAMADPALIEAAALLSDRAKVGHVYTPDVAITDVRLRISPPFEEIIQIAPPATGSEQIFSNSVLGRSSPVGWGRVRVTPDGQGDATLCFETRLFIQKWWNHLHTTTLAEFRTDKYDANTDLWALTTAAAAAATVLPAASPVPPNKNGAVNRVLGKMRSALRR